MKHKTNMPPSYAGETNKYTHDKDWNMESNRPILNEEMPSKRTDDIPCHLGLTFRQPL